MVELDGRLALAGATLDAAHLLLERASAELVFVVALLCVLLSRWLLVLVLVHLNLGLLDANFEQWSALLTFKAS